MYRPALLAVVVATSSLTLGLAACSSFGSAEDTDIPDSGPAAEAGTDGSPPDGAPPGLDGTAPDRDAGPEAASDAEAGAPRTACNASPAGCAAGLGCCLETGKNTCVAAAACDTFFLGCTKKADCAANEVCCFDTVSTSATCVPSTGCGGMGTKRRLCTLSSECAGIGAGDCTAVACDGPAGAVTSFMNACATAMTTPVSRGGLTCMVP